MGYNVDILKFRGDTYPAMGMTDDDMGWWPSGNNYQFADKDIFPIKNDVFP